MARVAAGEHSVRRTGVPQRVPQRSAVLGRAVELPAESPTNVTRNVTTGTCPTEIRWAVR